MSKSKRCCGPGYASPLDAMKNGPREKIIYVVTVQPDVNEPHGDYLSTVDVDPESPTFTKVGFASAFNAYYGRKTCKGRTPAGGCSGRLGMLNCKVIHRTFTNCKGNELHHTGWNACSSCHCVNDNAIQVPKRDKLVMPCLMSDNIYIVDTSADPRKPQIVKEISGDVLKAHNVTAPHTSHCLANGNIMISTMGDKDGNAKGDFILLDSEFNCIGTWTKGERKAMCGYDFWYQPYFDVMIATEWGAPKLWRRGWKNSDIDDWTQYGCRLNFYKWSTQTLTQTIDLGLDGATPLEVRFLHNPKEPQGFVGCCLNSKLYHFKKSQNSDQFVAKKVVDVSDKKIERAGSVENVGGMMSDIIISLDDRFLYFSNWLHGDVRQYDITNTENPRLVSQVFVGGCICKDSGVKVLEDKELKEQPSPRYIKSRRLEGGPQMLQLSLDGKRLYVSSSLFSVWDKQFYPKMVSAGGTIILLDIDTVNGGMTLNENFLVDFDKEPYGPTLPHEMRYPGGDCTSDIWLADEEH